MVHKSISTFSTLLGYYDSLWLSVYLLSAVSRLAGGSVSCRGTEQTQDKASVQRLLAYISGQ